MPRTLISTLEEFEEHYNSYISKGYNFFDKIRQPSTDKTSQVLKMGIHKAVFLIGVNASELIKKDCSHLFFYFIECQLNGQIIYVTVTRETAFLAFNINIGQIIEIYVSNIGEYVCAYLNPFNKEHFQPKATLSFLRTLNPQKDDSLFLSRVNDIVKFTNGRFLYIVENLFYSSTCISFILRSTTDECFKMKIILHEETNDCIKLSTRLENHRVDLEAINFDSYSSDRGILDVRNIIKINLRKEDFENLPTNPLEYPLPFTPIKVNREPNLPFEKWYAIPNYEQLYLVSNFGRIKSKNYEGYLYNEGIITSYEIKLSKKLSKEFFSRSEILTYAQQNFSQLIQGKEIAVLDYLIRGHITREQINNGLWYFKISIKDYNIYTTCYFLDYEIARLALAVLVSHLESIDVIYILR